jgi:hypothetical protein
MIKRPDSPTRMWIFDTSGKLALPAHAQHDLPSISERLWRLAHLHESCMSSATQRSAAISGCVQNSYFSALSPGAGFGEHTQAQLVFSYFPTDLIWSLSHARLFFGKRAVPWRSRRVKWKQLRIIIVHSTEKDGWSHHAAARCVPKQSTRVLFLLSR